LVELIENPHERTSPVQSLIEEQNEKDFEETYSVWTTVGMVAAGAAVGAAILLLSGCAVGLSSAGPVAGGAFAAS